MAQAQFSPIALEEIELAAAWYRREVSLALANRFLDSVETPVSMLISRPRIGSPCLFANPAVSGLRRWPIKGFKRWMVFYSIADDGIQVARVVHGSRDLEEVFAPRTENE